jgi:hypothetical protein
VRVKQWRDDECRVTVLYQICKLDPKATGSEYLTQHGMRYGACDRGPQRFQQFCSESINEKLVAPHEEMKGNVE